MIKKFEILVNGITPIDQKLFLAALFKEHDGRYYFEFDRYTLNPCILDSTLFWSYSVGHHDVAIAYDNNYPALNATPGSIGVLYSVEGPKDSIIFVSSNDGGLRFTNRRVLAVSTHKFRKVALSYGRSASKNSGRYFAAWEEQQDTISGLGHIYTSHSDPNFDSEFTSPVQLDVLDPSLTNLCRNPVIACQANNIDNDSTNLSEVVLFEKYNDATADYDITGFYNKKAATGTYFNKVNVAATGHNEMQPDIAFNEFDSSFVVTYYDSTNQKLPMLRKNLNLADPDNWEVVSPGYNKTYNIGTPNPRVSINMDVKQAINGWIGQRSSGNGVTLFNAPYIPPTGISEQNQMDNVLSLIHI